MTTQETPKLTGLCYIAITGSELENSSCRDSISMLQLQPGDAMRFIRGTKGYESRQEHIASFLEKPEFSFILMLDSDQTFPPNTLERLRSHGLPYVSGWYMRRRYNPIAPVWYEPGELYFPMRPWTAQVELGKLYEIGASGWGCVLIHRSVFEAVQPLLKGEQFVLEDDMDVLPYDLKTVMRVLFDLRTMVSEGVPVSVGRLHEQVVALGREIVPLRCVTDPVGSDVRFSYFARAAGVKLYGDAGVLCGHMLNYPLSMADWALLGETQQKQLDDVVNVNDKEERERLAAARARVLP